MCFSISWRSFQQVLNPFCVCSRPGFWLFVPKIMKSGAKEGGGRNLLRGERNTSRPPNCANAYCIKLIFIINIIFNSKPSSYTLSSCTVVCISDSSSTSSFSSFYAIFILPFATLITLKFREGVKKTYLLQPC